jgi:hypothetical protein
MTVKRKGRIPTDYTLHPREMMKIGVAIERDIQEHVLSGRTPSGGSQTKNQPATIRKKRHAIPLVGDAGLNHRFALTRWDKHPGFGVLLLSLPKHGHNPSAWQVMEWLTQPGKRGKRGRGQGVKGLLLGKQRQAYKPIMSISPKGAQIVVNMAKRFLRNHIARESRKAAKSSGS